jgi:hypothetical protein
MSGEAETERLATAAGDWLCEWAVEESNLQPWD